ncbi:hypothetical protein [Kordia sp.]|uniref:hypothetical protein n=1 Tax=Kordia sp. TaxID=1965332 RepID=UPI003D6C2F0C
MKIKGYSIWKPLVICEGVFDVAPFETALIIFLKGFPDLANEFYAGNEFWIKPEEAYLHFLEELILERLESITKEGDWRNEYKQEHIALLKKAQMIIKFEFLGKQYEINTFGDRNASTTMDLISFYNALVDVKDGLGLKVTPKTN